MWNWTSINLSDPDLFMTYELLAAGYDGQAIARMVRSGRLHRIRHGAYTTGEHWRSLDDRGRQLLTARAVLRSARSLTLLSGPTAALLLGAPVWDLGNEVHVTRVDARADRRQAGRVPHRGVILAEDVTVRDGLPVTSGTKTALDMMTIADTERALVVVDGLLHAGETSLPLLERRMGAMGRDPHSLKFPLMMRYADPRHESAGETRTSLLVRRAGMPLPIPQYEVRDREGRFIGRVDFAWPDEGVFLEFDGKEKYLRYRRPGESVADAVIREKLREDKIREVTGWRCIRLTWADLYYPERTAARIAAVLGGGAWAA